MILGLDVSTSVTGYTVIDENDHRVIKMGHIDFKNCTGLWEKADLAKSELSKLLGEFKVDNVYIEESLMSFSSGMSSALTITTLSKFNALVSYIVREIVGYDPTHVSAASARKAIGVKLLQKKKCGLSHKEQTFLWCTGPLGPLSKVEFPKTKTGKFKPYVFDEVDSFVIALAGCLLNKKNKQL